MNTNYQTGTPIMQLKESNVRRSETRRMEELQRKAQPSPALRQNIYFRRSRDTAKTSAKS